MTDKHGHRASVGDAYDILDTDDDEPIVEVTPAELAAMHSIPDDERSTLDDPARREVAVGYEADVSPASWFADEEPEVVGPDDLRADEETPDVEDLLVVQHYAFEEETDEEAAPTEDED